MGGLIPSRVIWSIFEGLVSAVCLMHFGYLPPLNVDQTFQPLMHRDIKPSNGRSLSFYSNAEELTIASLLVNARSDHLAGDPHRQGMKRPIPHRALHADTAYSSVILALQSKKAIVQIPIQRHRTWALLDGGLQ